MAVSTIFIEYDLIQLGAVGGALNWPCVHVSHTAYFDWLRCV